MIQVEGSGTKYFRTVDVEDYFQPEMGWWKGKGKKPDHANDRWGHQYISYGLQEPGADADPETDDEACMALTMSAPPSMTIVGIIRDELTLSLPR